MKNLLILISFVFFFHTLHAQEETRKGFILGGSLSVLVQNNTSPAGFSFSPIGGIFSPNSNNSRSKTLTLSPYFGFELRPGNILGFLLDFRTGTYTSDLLIVGEPSPVDFERNSDQFGFGVFYRYAFNPENRLNLFLQPHLEYNLFNEKEYFDADLASEEKANFIEAGLGTGALYALSDLFNATLRFGLINYVNGRWEIIGSGTERDFSSFTTSLSLSNISIGVELKL